MPSVKRFAQFSTARDDSGQGVQTYIVHGVSHPCWGQLCPPIKALKTRGREVQHRVVARGATSPYFDRTGPRGRLRRPRAQDRAGGRSGPRYDPERLGRRVCAPYIIEAYAAADRRSAWSRRATSREGRTRSRAWRRAWVRARRRGRSRRIRESRSAAD